MVTKRSSVVVERCSSFARKSLHIGHVTGPKPVTCITCLTRNYLKSEVNIQAMSGVLIDLILTFFSR